MPTTPLQPKERRIPPFAILVALAFLAANIALVVMILRDVYLPGLSEIFSYELMEHSFYLEPNFLKATLLPVALMSVWFVMAKGAIVCMNIFMSYSNRDDTVKHHFLTIVYTIFFMVLCCKKIEYWGNGTIYFLLFPFWLSLAWSEFFCISRYKMSLFGFLCYDVLIFFFLCISVLWNVNSMLGFLVTLVLIGIVVLVVLGVIAARDGKETKIVGIAFFFKE